MSRTVWKYPLPVQGRFLLDMPVGAQLLHVDLQEGAPCLWAMVDPLLPPAPRSFRIFGTGHLIPDGPPRLVYTATFQCPPLVWHLFEEVYLPGELP